MSILVNQSVHFKVDSTRRDLGSRMTVGMRNRFRQKTRQDEDGEYHVLKVTVNHPRETRAKKSMSLTLPSRTVSSGRPLPM